MLTAAQLLKNLWIGHKPQAVVINHFVVISVDFADDVHLWRNK